MTEIATVELKLLNLIKVAAEKVCEFTVDNHDKEFQEVHEELRNALAAFNRFRELMALTGKESALEPLIK